MYFQGSILGFSDISAKSTLLVIFADQCEACAEEDHWLEESRLQGFLCIGASNIIYSLFIHCKSLFIFS